MNENVPFLAPRMVGERFDEHSIPLEVLRDLAALEEMIVEVAKWHYLKENTDRKRSPRGFTDGVSLRLSEIDEGSAIAKIALVLSIAPGHLFAENQSYFEKARDSIVAVIDAAEQNEQITGHLEDSHLAYFDKIGRSLRDNEAIEFNHTNRERPASFNRKTRRVLTHASTGMSEFTEDVTLRGAVSETDQNRKRFELELYDGTVIRAPLQSQHWDTVLEASVGYRKGDRVSIRGVAKYDRNGKLKKIESVEHLDILEPNDAASRLDAFRLMKDGWLDGKGVAPTLSLIDQVTNGIQVAQMIDLPTPYLYPTPEGGIQAEWTIGNNDVSVEVMPDGNTAEWHVLDLESGDVEVAKMKLASGSQSWLPIMEKVRELEGIRSDA